MNAQAKKLNLGVPLSFGLDIGIASVGWAVLAPDHVVNLGVRAFDKAETAKEGESLNLARRTARLTRRRLFRRAWRMVKVSRLLKSTGLIESVDFFKAQPGFAESTWCLRVQALDRELTATELARVIYHLCKHRGFHWVSKAEERAAENDKKEGGKVTQGLKETKRLLEQTDPATGQSLYRTAAEMLLRTSPEVQRNKAGDYGKALSRVLLDAELVAIFEAQQRLGNPLATPALLKQVRGEPGSRGGLFWQQKPALAGTDLLKMLGKCTFEKAEHRAPKASFSAERHVWLTKLNNMRITQNGVARGLNEAERLIALNLPYQSAEAFTYKHLRNALQKAGIWDKNVKFTGMSYPAEDADKKTKHPEDAVLCKLSGWHDLKKTLTSAGCESQWLQWSTDALLEGRPEVLDHIAWVLTVYKDDESVAAELAKLQLGSLAAELALQNLRFDKFSNLSLKALRNIVPHMERGLRYDEAVAQIAEYGHHSVRIDKGAGKHLYLPPFYEQARDPKKGSMVFRQDMDIPRNPVVLRALNQARKVVNALIAQYGAPHQVHIELARDLSRPMLGKWSDSGKYIEGRRDIEAKQKQFAQERDDAKDAFQKEYGYEPKGREFEKVMLYREQHGKCAYSLVALDLNRVLSDKHYVQVDHALPYSRSYDDSKNNKVLVLTRENQNKGNRTPFEYLGGAQNSERWQQFEAWVNGNKSYRQAKRSRLLRKNYGPEEAQGFKDRNLNDTRYICKFFKNYVEQYLQLAPGADGSTHQRCVVVNGQLTAFLRARWGFVKVRSDSDRHHALDAAVVAACSHAMVKRLADYSRKRELRFLHEGFADPETGDLLNPAAHRILVEHFPKPWAGFFDEVLLRLNTDDPAKLREDATKFGTYSAAELTALRPLFVSRAVKRRGGGSIHEAMLRSPKYTQLQKSAIKKNLTQLSLSDLDNIVEAHGRNKPLVEALRQQMAKFGNNSKLAFQEPFFKPTEGINAKTQKSKIAPIVRSISILSTQKSGIHLPNAIAELGEMTGLHILRTAQGYYFEPQYIARQESRLSVKATPIDAIFEFFITKNDLLEVHMKGAVVLGYFVMFESDGRMTLRAHDQPIPDKAYFRRGVASANLIRKLNVDILGNIYPARPEKRRGLA